MADTTAMLREIVAMGFSEQQASVALRSANGDPEAAIELLLTGGGSAQPQSDPFPSRALRVMARAQRAPRQAWQSLAPSPPPRVSQRWAA